MTDPLASYLRAFSTLRSDRTAGWTELTRLRAPHKPFLLLSVLDLCGQGLLPTNFIEPMPELGELFAAYWTRIMPPERRGNLALPFFHLRSSGFWHLVPQPGQAELLKSLSQIDSLARLKKVCLGATLDPELFELLQNAVARETLRSALLETCFAPDAQTSLRSQTALNQQTFVYSQELIEQAHRPLHEVAPVYAEPDPFVRDQGFRKAITHIYLQRCAFCGLRLLTVDGHSVVEAAHIIPWSLTHNDDLHNGLALCKLCHWSFDEGLLSISDGYLLLVSDDLRGSANLPGHLLTFANRSILGPAEPALFPALDSLSWHRGNVFRKE
jgi:putative restriction endonuclease